MNFFITGTDTDVGKTFFTALFLRALRSAGIDAVGFKPITCGGWEDVDALVEAGGNVEPRLAVCGMKLDMPASPLTAAWAEQTVIDTASIFAAYREIASRHEMVVVEGVGGWLVPITPEYCVADLATELGLPVIVVVRNRIGALNHTLLTIENLRRRGLYCAGLVLNHVGVTDELAAHSNRATFELLRTAPVLCELVQGQQTLDLALLSLPGLRR
ncbi:MAG: dethiobiotin synthase [Terrimicrobiaceae bacterium]|nr:dethiobiotin synthase [Terrimicrobiaceae bacterium]